VLRIVLIFLLETLFFYIWSWSLYFFEERSWSLYYLRFILFIATGFCWLLHGWPGDDILVFSCSWWIWVCKDHVFWWT